MIDIQVKNLTKFFVIGENLLDGVLSFDIQEGERVAVLGRNGCGKTTLFKILTGEMDYDEGEVYVNPNKKLGLIYRYAQIPGWVYGGGCAPQRLPGIGADPAENRSGWKRKWHAGDETSPPAGGTTTFATDSPPAAAMRWMWRWTGLRRSCGWPPATPRSGLCQACPVEKRPRIEPCPAAAGKNRYPAAGRAHQPPRPAQRGMAGGMQPGIQGNGAGHVP